MKKSLFALAALGAFATAAQAQSTVTLSGAFDSSVVYITGIPNTTAVNTNTSVNNTFNTGTGYGFIDGAIVTSNWAMKGSEDMGGGMKANFHLESDIESNNGTTHSGGLFRRAANVSIADAKLGEVFLGRRGNAYILATSQMLPVQGNTAHQWRSVINSSVGDQISNSITYASPVIMKTNIVAQVGLNNSIDNGDDGQQTAAHLVNKSIQGLTILAAYNNQKTQNANGLQTSISQGSNAVSATGRNLEGYAVGLKYQVTPAIEVGTFYAHGRQNNSLANGTAAQILGTTGISTGAGGLGVGYQATPNILLGANYVKTTFQAQMVNLQGHYMFSKRTRLYSQITLNQAAKGNYQYGSLAANSFSPTACNSNTVQTCFNAIPTTAGAQNVNTDSRGYGIGVIHMF